LNQVKVKPTFQNVPFLTITKETTQKMTIQEIRQKLYSKEILSESDLLRLRGGDGEEDKRKELLAALAAAARAWLANLGIKP
jgi:hypothetical protein